MRINKEKQENLFKTYTITWTPTILILDAQGEEHYRFTGFLPPLEFSAAIILEGAKAELDLQNYDLAIKCFNEVIEKYRERPRSRRPSFICTLPNTCPLMTQKICAWDSTG